MSNKNNTNWTPSQETAIYEKDKQLLVAAGAGSGKTSVLTQRILEKIKSGSDVKNFLVVTFTVASADDMKEKLRRKLTEEYVKNPENKHLSSQIAKLPFAQISTMSSYCLKLVKQNFTALDLPPSLRVADESEATSIFEDAFDALLDEKFSAKDEALYMVLNETACAGKEEYLFKYLDTIYKKLRAHSDYINKLKTLTYNFTSSAEMCLLGTEATSTPVGKILTDALFLLCADADEKINKFLEKGEELGGSLETLAATFASFFKSGKSHAEKGEYTESERCYRDATAFYTDAWRKTSVFKGLDEEEKKAYNKLRLSARDAARKVLDYLSEFSNRNEDIFQCAKIAESLTTLIIRLDELYNDIKKEKGVLDFTDAEQYAHKLLIDQSGEQTPLCREIADSLEEVLVDEYQDTNPLQDEIFASLAIKNNRFMVGDDKQSIYRFRNAYPDIFNNYKKSFHTETASCIFLRENFRCSKQIIDFTNIIFDFLWGEPYKTEGLKFAKTGGENGPAVTVKTFINSKIDLEHEARYIKNEILKLKQSYIKENGEPLLYSDIAILLPTVKETSEIFAEELRKGGIPVISGRPGLLIETPEVKLVLSYLKAVNNPLEDIPLASAMNSFFFGFTADELVKIRDIKNTSLYESVIKYSSDRLFYPKMHFVCKKTQVASSKKVVHFRKKEVAPLVEKCKEFIKKLNDLRYKARTVECRQFIWEAYEKSNILNNIATLPEGETKKGNLLLLYSEAIAFGKRERKSLSAFIKHAEKLCTPAHSPAGMDSVSIMTIHSSKGLEFPVCFLANAGKSLLPKTNGIKPPIIHIEKGIFTPLKTNDIYTRYPILYKAEEILEKPADISEKKRMLYVALTRAREKLYVVGTGKDIDSLQNSLPSAPTSYLSWIHTASPPADYLYSETEEDIEVVQVTPPLYSEYATKEEEEKFVYPFESSVKIPRKLSVSELEQNSKEKYNTTVRKKDFLTIPRFAAETKKVSAAEIGTANHTFMQFASFENCVNLGVEYEGERLLMADMLTNEQYGMLNFKSLRKFFKSTLWNRISKSNAVFREKRFTVANNSNDLLGKGNEIVLVQGVIDLFFENEDGTYTVVDYKTDKIKEGEENLLSERYKGQLSYYASAVKEMTEKDVKECIIYSFSLDKEITIQL